jgi:hypothetical protein
MAWIDPVDPIELVVISATPVVPVNPVIPVNKVTLHRRRKSPTPCRPGTRLQRYAQRCVRPMRMAFGRQAKQKTVKEALSDKHTRPESRR